MATPPPPSASAASNTDRNAQSQRKAKPQNMPSKVWSEPVSNNTPDPIIDEGMMQQQHEWPSEASTSNEFFLSESPTMKKFQVVCGPTPRTPSPPMSHEPVYFNSEEDEDGYYIPPDNQLQVGDGFLMSHLGNGRDPSVAQRATMRYLPDQYGDEGTERDVLPTNEEASFRGSLEFYSDSFFKSWDMGFQGTAETTGCGEETAGKAGS